MHPAPFSPSEPLACRVPSDLHPACRNLLDQFVTGRTSIDLPAYVCNMVDSSLLPMVQCLVDAYGSGRILMPGAL
jgi:hypothetical protein